MTPCIIAALFLMVVLYFTYEPGVLPFLGGAGHEDADEETHGNSHKKDKTHQDLDQLYGDDDDDEQEGGADENDHMEAFSMIDADGNGRIMPGEFKDFNDKMMKDQQQLMQDMQGQSGGLIDEEDEELNIEDMNMAETNTEEDEVNMEHINDLDDRLDKIEDHLNMPADFNDLDKDKDGMISPDEYGQSGGGGCSSGHTKEEEKVTGGSSWGGLEAYDDSSGFAAF